MGRRRRFSAEEKLAMVMEGLKGFAVKDVCAKKNSDEKTQTDFLTCFASPKWGKIMLRAMLQRHEPQRC